MRIGWLPAVILGVGCFHASPALAYAPPEQPRAVGLELGSQWASDDWLTPSGTRYRVAGQFGRLGLAARWPWNHHLDLAALGVWSPLTRSDTNETLTRVGGRVVGSFARSWSHHPHPVDDYQIDAGLGMLVDVQSHRTAGAPRGRLRDYLDETQFRVGPVAKLNLLWFHPRDERWRAQLELMAAPGLLGFSTGNVAFPGNWNVLEARLGPIWRVGAGEVSAGVEAQSWQGGTFAQRSTGVFLRGAWRF